MHLAHEEGLFELRDAYTGMLLKRVPIPGNTLVASESGWQLAFGWGIFNDDSSRLVIIPNRARRSLGSSLQDFGTLNARRIRLRKWTLW